MINRTPLRMSICQNFNFKCTFFTSLHHGREWATPIFTLWSVILIPISVTAPSDYMALTQEQTFNSGTPRVCVSITLVGDGSNEDSETFSVSLTSTDGAVVLGWNVTTVTIGMSQLWSHAFMLLCIWYKYIIWWVRRQYGWILHECAAVFLRAAGEWKYSTRVQ